MSLGFRPVAKDCQHRVTFFNFVGIHVFIGRDISFDRNPNETPRDLVQNELAEVVAGLVGKHEFQKTFVIPLLRQSLHDEQVDFGREVRYGKRRRLALVPAFRRSATRERCAGLPRRQFGCVFGPSMRQLRGERGRESRLAVSHCGAGPTNPNTVFRSVRNRAVHPLSVKTIGSERKNLKKTRRIRSGLALRRVCLMNTAAGELADGPAKRLQPMGRSCTKETILLEVQIETLDALERSLRLRQIASEAFGQIQIAVDTISSIWLHTIASL